MSSEALELRTRLAAARLQQGAGTQAAVDAGMLPEGSLPTPAELAQEQVRDAIERGRMDLSGSPRFPWTDIDRLIGPMLPGDLVVPAALTGNGKTTFLMSMMDAQAERHCSTLYIPLETDPQEMRRRWAAWKLKLDVVKVLRNQWDALPEGSQDAHESAMDDQILNPYIHFAPPKYITVGEIRKWVQWAYSHLGIRQVILDHFQRVDHGNDRGAAHRLAVHDTARALRDLARELGIVIIAAGQLHRTPDPLDAMKPPAVSRLKDAGGIGEEANIVIMLSKRLKPGLGKDDFAAYRQGQLKEWQMVDPGVMEVTCRKHRLDGLAVDRSALLKVENGRVEDYYRYWRGENDTRDD